MAESLDGENEKATAFDLFAVALQMLVFYSTILVVLLLLLLEPIRKQASKILPSAWQGDKRFHRMQVLFIGSYHLPEWHRDVFSAFIGFDDILLVFRPHPTMPPEELNEIKRFAGKKKIRTSFDNTSPPAEQMEKANVIIGGNSSLLIEAAILEKPIVLCIFPSFPKRDETWLKMGMPVAVAGSPGQLREILLSPVYGYLNHLNHLRQ